MTFKKVRNDLYVKHVDLTDHSGRIFFVGDLHGMFHAFEYALKYINFDPSKDVLFTTGDLIDRGLNSDLMLYKFVRKENEGVFFSVRGNHEDMLIDPELKHCHYMNGGKWIENYSDEFVEELKNRAKSLPLVIDIKLPDGRTCGITHAYVPPISWDLLDMKHSNVLSFNYEKIIWNRSQFSSRIKVSGVDFTVHGHTPIVHDIESVYPKGISNQYFIDTGSCFQNGDMTIFEYDSSNVENNRALKLVYSRNALLNE